MKKRDLIALNRRREIQRRVKFLKDRMRDMPLELKYAEGITAALPTRLATPPSWALAAARIGANGINKPVAHLKPHKGKKYQGADLAELIGYYYAMVRFVQNPPKTVKEVEKDVPELDELLAPLAKQTARGFIKFLRRIRRKRNEPPVILTVEELSERASRYAKGLTAFSTPEGELRGLELLSTRLYYSIWMFWPFLEKRFNAPAIHLWICETLGESPSDKTVEAIVTRLRKEAVLIQP